MERDFKMDFKMILSMKEMGKEFRYGTGWRRESSLETARLSVRISESISRTIRNGRCTSVQNQEIRTLKSTPTLSLTSDWRNIKIKIEMAYIDQGAYSGRE